ncbi:uncharacterized protein LOC144112617 isoform X2 [Amblyomma americanum]
MMEKEDRDEGDQDPRRNDATKEFICPIGMEKYIAFKRAVIQAHEINESMDALDKASDEIEKKVNELEKTSKTWQEESMKSEREYCAGLAQLEAVRKILANCRVVQDQHVAEWEEAEIKLRDLKGSLKQQEEVIQVAKKAANDSVSLFESRCNDLQARVPQVEECLKLTLQQQDEHHTRLKRALGWITASTKLSQREAVTASQPTGFAVCQSGNEEQQLLPRVDECPKLRLQKEDKQRRLRKRALGWITPSTKLSKREAVTASQPTGFAVRQSANDEQQLREGKEEVTAEQLSAMIAEMKIPKLISPIPSPARDERPEESLELPAAPPEPEQMISKQPGDAVGPAKGEQRGQASMGHRTSVSWNPQEHSAQGWIIASTKLSKRQAVTAPQPTGSAVGRSGNDEQQLRDPVGPAKRRLQGQASMGHCTSVSWNPQEHSAQGWITASTKLSKREAVTAPQPTGSAVCRSGNDEQQLREGKEEVTAEQLRAMFAEMKIPKLISPIPSPARDERPEESLELPAAPPEPEQMISKQPVPQVEECPKLKLQKEDKQRRFRKRALDWFEYVKKWEGAVAAPQPSGFAAYRSGSDEQQLWDPVGPAKRRLQGQASMGHCTSVSWNPQEHSAQDWTMATTKLSQRDVAASQATGFAVCRSGNDEQQQCAEYVTSGLPAGTSPGPV